MPAAPQVEVSGPALADIARVVLFLASRNPAAAKRLRDAISAAFDTIQAAPGVGRRYWAAPAGTEVRERVVRFGQGAYIVRYAVEPEAVTILRIHHAREDR